MSTLLEQASLVLIPSGYKEDTVYSVIPSNGSGDMSFTRASDGTRINSDGLVEVTPWNLLTYSEDLSNAIWALSSATISTNATTAPNGTLTADKFIGTATNAVHFFQQSAVSSSYVFSIYAKAGEENVFSMWIANTSKRAEFNLTTGTIPLSTVANSSIVNVGNGWYRCSVYDSSPTTTYRIYGRTGSSYLGNGVDGMFFWGAQLNDGTTAKPYFPTTDRLNVPRLTYQNGGGGCPSLLLEPQRTNILTYSQEFNDATWGKTNVSATANTTISPDGTTNADTITSLTAAEGRIIQTKNISALLVYSGTVFVKKDTNESRFPEFYLRTEGVSFNEIYVQLNTKTGASVIRAQNGTVSQSVESFVDYWRIKLTVTNTADTTITLGIRPAVTNVFGTYNPQIGSVIVWGAQVEAGSYASSYIPTTSASATRIADACLKTGISSLIGQTEGTLFVDSTLTHNATSNEYLIQVSASSTIRFFIYREAVTNKLGCFAIVNGTSTYTQLTASAITGTVKAAFAYKSGSFAFYVNGVQVGISSATFSAFASMGIFNIDSNVGAENGFYNYNQAILFPTRLTNSELALITTL